LRRLAHYLVPQFDLELERLSFLRSCRGLVFLVLVVLKRIAEKIHFVLGIGRFSEVE
jgi:hypothetical protein